MPITFAGAGPSIAALPTGKIMGAGGTAYEGPDAHPPQHLGPTCRSVEPFRPATGSWAPIGSAGDAPFRHGAVLLATALVRPAVRRQVGVPPESRMSPSVGDANAYSHRIDMAERCRAPE